MIGHIKIDRKILDWEWYKDVNVAHLFIYLILKANFKDSKWQGHSVKRGEIITGRLRISADTGLTERQIRTSISKLRKTKEISIKTTSKFSIITICKYDIYQSFVGDSDQQIDQQKVTKETNKRPTNDQQATTSEEELIISRRINKEHDKIKNDIPVNTMPKADSFNGLPESKIGASIELVRITKQTDINKKNVQDMWGVFKIQNLTGKRYYADDDAVYSHFINWIKKQDFKENKNAQPKINL